jgi:hypothetical protein
VGGPFLPGDCVAGLHPAADPSLFSPAGFRERLQEAIGAKDLCQYHIGRRRRLPDHAVLPGGGLSVAGTQGAALFASAAAEPAFFVQFTKYASDHSVVGMYEASVKWTLSADFVYHTGQAVTYPSGKYDVNGQTDFYYTNRNASRMPAYDRLDLAATVVTKKTARSESSWTFSVYNAYDRANAYAIIFQQNPNNAEQTQAVKYTLYKLVPFVTFNFKF